MNYNNDLLQVLFSDMDDTEFMNFYVNNGQYIGLYMNLLDHITINNLIEGIEVKPLKGNDLVIEFTKSNLKRVNISLETPLGNTTFNFKIEKNTGLIKIKSIEEKRESKHVKNNNEYCK